MLAATAAVVTCSEVARAIACDVSTMPLTLHCARVGGKWGKREVVLVGGRKPGGHVAYGCRAASRWDGP